MRFLYLLILFALSVNAHGALRVATYNIAQGEIRTGLDTVLNAMGSETHNGINRPIDILILEEQDSVATSTESVRVILNNLFPDENYLRSTLDGGGAGGTIGAVYNANTVSLAGQITVYGNPRDILRYTFMPVGYTSPDAAFYIYGMHLKASTGSDNEDKRAADAARIRSNADILGTDINIIYTGDFNIYDNYEQAYINFLADGNGQAIDPLGLENSGWSGSYYRQWHTQAPSSSSVSGMVGGGMDDRFDFQLISNALNDQEGLAIIDNSYRTFGNNGSHYYDSSITTGSGAAASVLTAMTTATDHCPVVAEYQLPAKMEIEALSQLPDTKVICPGYTFNIKVRNNASDIYDDELDYTISTNVQQDQPQDNSGDSQWLISDIGSPAISGSANISDESITITGSGQIPNRSTSDSCCYVYKSLTGDGELAMNLSSLLCSTPGGDAGLMIRSSLESSSPFAFIFQNIYSGLKWRYRTSSGSNSANAIINSSSTLPTWLKLERSGNTITSYYSTDGIGWTTASSQTIALPETVLIGMAVGEYSNTVSTTAIFALDDSGGVSGDSFTLAGTNSRTHYIAVDENNYGSGSISINISSNSQAVENAYFATTYNYYLSDIADFDGDFDLDIADINLLINAIGTVNSKYDLDSSGEVDITDLQILITEHMGYKMGDINLDHITDISDLSILLNNYLSEQQGWENGDFNNDSNINVIDFSIISENWNLN